MTDWIECNIDRLYGYAYSLSHDSEDARDLVQECFLRAMEASRRPGDDAAIRAWLFRILRNLFIDKRRLAGREIFFGDPDLIEPEEDTVWVGDSRLVDIVMIRVALSKLPIAHREIIALVDFAGCTYADAAKILEIPTGTVMSRLSRARRALLNLVAEDNVTSIGRGVAAGGARR